MTPVDFHPAAMDEAVAARQGYNEIDPSLAEAFDQELELGVNSIALAPQRWTKHLYGTRMYLLHRFPYLLVYRALNNRVQMIAVQHGKRRPGYWKSRISPR